MSGSSADVAWDYSALARPYLKRPDYSAGGLNAMLAVCETPQGGQVCDIGAGAGHLTIPLAERGFVITAVEPNDAMRELGTERTRKWADVRWIKGTGEHTSCESSIFDLVCFGSSFNVTDRPAALLETHRLLKPGGWFVCMWNHRELQDPIQMKVEAVIKRFIPDYDYGVRREDQTNIIQASGLFDTPHRIEAPVLHHVQFQDWIEAWKSHATLDRQAGGRLEEIVESIKTELEDYSGKTLTIPYTTRIWMARVRP